MSTYLIDFENVKSNGLSGIEYIRKEDSVHLFWSNRENKITIEMMELIRSSESEIVMHKAVTGERDALDHQLCSYLGFLAGGKGETDFVIVSNDKAYDHLIEFWRRMNDSVRIRRVPEISKISETLRTLETVAAAEVPSEECTEKVENMGNTETETAFTDVRGSRNFRRRERGGKYLKGGRTGRNNWKNVYSEEPSENHTVEEYSEEPAVYSVKPFEESWKKQATEKHEEYPENYEAKTVGEPLEKYITKTVEEQSENLAAKDTKEYPEKRTTEVARERFSPAAVVVTGIKTGILVESGYTADGILDHRNTMDENQKGEQKKEITEKKDSTIAPSLEKQNVETVSEIKVDKESLEYAEKTTIVAVEPAKETDEKKTAEPAKETNEKKTAEAAKEIDEKKTVEAAKEIDEKKTVEAAKEIDEKRIAEAAQQTEVLAAASSESEEKNEKGEETKEVPEKKTRTRTPHTAGRAKRGRPPKKERIEHVPEAKAPVTEADVIAKYEAAVNAEWTGEIVRLINHSRDKKELYAAVVKLLGQEKGRTVYHEIKVLK